MAQHTESETGATRSRRREETDEAEIQELLDGMARGLTAGDGRKVASLWETPALVLGDEDARGVGAQAEVEQFFGGAREQYNARGITDTRADIVRVQWLTERIATVEVRWPYLDARGRELGEETSTYVLRRDKAGALKIRAAIMHGARTH